MLGLVCIVTDAGAFGIGVMLGEPTGVSFKQWVTKENAFGGAVAWSFERKSALHVHLDYLYHRRGMRPGRREMDAGRVLFYFGVGGRVKAEEDDSRIGVRIPLGIDYVFAGSPFDIFFEIAPLLDLAPSTEFRVNGGFGIRYYF
jgi:hypothetical protein